MVLVIIGPVGRDDVTFLCDRVERSLSSGGAPEVVCDVGFVAAPDVDTVDVLARMALAARRAGGRLRLRHVREDLRELLCLAGLDDVMPSAPLLDGRRQPEQGEQARRIEEEGDAGDPSL